MSYDLSCIQEIDSLLYNKDDNRNNIVKSLNLKHSVYKTYNDSVGVSYNILKYDKQWLLNEQYNTIGLLRSLIFKDDGDIMCFSPPKSYDANILTEEDFDNNKYTAEKYVEGTMINLFYDTNMVCSVTKVCEVAV